MSLLVPWVSPALSFSTPSGTAPKSGLLLLALSSLQGMEAGMKIESADKTTTPFWKKGLLLGAVLLFTSLLFAQTLQFAFVWDDNVTHLQGNRTLMRGQVGKLWTAPYEGLYVPVAYTTWWALASVAKQQNRRGIWLSPRVFHAANLVVHLLNTSLVFLILLLLFRGSVGAMLGALLFAVHPVQVETVAWVSEWRGLLCGLGVLVSLYSYIRYHMALDTVSSASKTARWGWWVGVLLGFGFALLSKPAAVVLPVMLALLHPLLPQASWRRSLTVLIVGGLLSLPIVLLTKQLQPDIVLQQWVPLFQRPWIVLDTVAFYIQKVLVPFPLCASYGRTPTLVLSQTIGATLGHLVPLGLLAGLLVLGRKHRVLWVGVAIFLVGFAPVSGVVGFVFQKFSTVADRYLYLSMFGLALVLGYWGAQKPRAWSLGLVALVVLGWSFLTSTQVAAWKNEEAVWSHTIRYFPHQSQPYTNRGNLYLQQGKLRKALHDFSKSIHYAPQIVSNYTNRANVLSNLQQFAQALQDYSTALRLTQRKLERLKGASGTKAQMKRKMLQSDAAFVLYNRGVAQFMMKQYDAALRDLKFAQRYGRRVPPQLLRDIHRERSSSSHKPKRPKQRK
ncbi:MAG: hypothetical protein EP343_14815 [Deltaproteobacteria bacterium]|nr:MAG: hypothetical protein EP343_14815 [Deltaproteobacteria bacterium]